MATIRLGLIGAGIGRSSAPRLHVAAGRLCGLEVTYELRSLEGASSRELDRALVAARDDGCVGLNVTHPFKEMAYGLVRIEDVVVRALGAVNTIRFVDGSTRVGHNTDHTGFLQAFRRRFAGESPGDVGVVGAGGVGRVVAFGLAELGATSLRVHDRDASRARRIAADVAAAHPRCRARACETIAEIAEGADGLVNCTPLGMYQYPGTAIPAEYLAGRRWAFDAVYTPIETTFLAEARGAGLEILSGYELFLFQGIDAFEIFTGERVDEAALREALAA